MPLVHEVVWKLKWNAEALLIFMFHTDAFMNSEQGESSNPGRLQ